MLFILIKNWDRKWLVSYGDYSQKSSRAMGVSGITNLPREEVYQIETVSNLRTWLPKSYNIYTQVTVKKDGKRMYKYAREKIEIEIEPREIEIYDFEILNFSAPYIEFVIKCSKGTYIRSIANDYGQKLNSGSHLYELKRISIGDFSISDALRFK